jgi:hypothetical protein
MNAEYIETLLNPFTLNPDQLKLRDGSIASSSGLRFRTTGNLTLDGTGGDNFIVLCPGLAQGVSWKNTPGQVEWNMPAPYSEHIVTPGPGNPNIRKIRLVSSALKLSLLNNADDSEGYWEAIRMPMDSIEWAAGGALIPGGPTGGYMYHLSSSQEFGNFADYPTFQTGRLRDLHRFQFKLNSVSPVHTFNRADDPIAGERKFVDPHFDIVVIRLVGRLNVAAPTMILYNHISNQEIVFKPNTLMGRLQLPNRMIPNMGMILERTRQPLPGVKII